MLVRRCVQHLSGGTVEKTMMKRKGRRRE